ncbi:hypothetical protein TNCV_5119981 [Trichonephila clavipes]|nr:hypothetical protein TNCV_5119981 [Trichonephila clavipes]
MPKGPLEKVFTFLKLHTAWLALSPPCSCRLEPPFGSKCTFVFVPSQSPGPVWAPSESPLQTRCPCETESTSSLSSLGLPWEKGQNFRPPIYETFPQQLGKRTDLSHVCRRTFFTIREKRLAYYLVISHHVVHIKFFKAQNPQVGMIWKFGEGNARVQTPSSSIHLGKKDEVHRNFLLLASEYDVTKNVSHL